MPIKPAKRTYKCTDGTLIQKSGQIANCITRDQAQFSSFGVLPATVTAFRVLIADFELKITDDEAVGEQTTATATKGALRKGIENDLRTTRGIVQDVYKGAGKYRKFGFDDFTKLGDNDFIRMAKRVQRVLAQVQTEIVDDKPIVADLINSLDTLIEQFDTALDTVADKKNERDIATQNRVLAGNSVYAELVRLCDIGKTIFQDNNEAKYNDFVLNLYMGPVPAEDTDNPGNTGE
ncbi:MAG TPA: hypothetical protein VJ720_02420 [Chitinophaga sp.]|nr:hypothetical protein [Chitinophaga sp.]